MSLHHPTVAIVGATGAVGVELIGCLEQRSFPLERLRLFASARSAGRRLLFRGQGVAVEELNEDSFSGIDIALFSAGGAASRAFAPMAVRQGAVVVDNSSAFRMDPAVPLVVPEMNAEAIARHLGIIANPNCAAIIAIMPLWPIHRHNRIRRLIAAPIRRRQAPARRRWRSCASRPRAYLDGPRLPTPRAAASLCVQPVQPQHQDGPVDRLQRRGDQGDARDAQDLRRARPACRLTCVRVPVLRAHAVALTVEFERPIAPDEARAMLAGAPGVRIVDDIERNHFPMPKEASGQDDILVGRIRRDLSDPSGPLDRAVRGRRPAAEGRGAERGADRRATRGVATLLRHGRAKTRPSPN